MCTLTVIPDQHGYVVTMNRDEYRTRQEAGLRTQHANGINYAYPVDAQAGGSWIGMNDHGVTMALLNRYQAPTIENAKTRGAIIPSILPHEPNDAVLALKSLDPSYYNPFDCVLISTEGCFHFSWNSQQVSWQQCDITNGLMMTSSSERLDEVRDYREQQFDRLRIKNLDVSNINLFHLSQPETMASSAMFMARELTHTKSVVQIAVNKSCASLDYYNQQQLKPNVELSVLAPSERVSMPLNPSSNPNNVHKTSSVTQ